MGATAVLAAASRGGAPHHRPGAADRPGRPRLSSLLPDHDRAVAQARSQRHARPERRPQRPRHLLRRILRTGTYLPTVEPVASTVDRAISIDNSCTIDRVSRIDYTIDRASRID